MWSVRPCDCVHRRVPKDAARGRGRWIAALNARAKEASNVDQQGLWPLPGCANLLWQRCKTRSASAMERCQLSPLSSRSISLPGAIVHSAACCPTGPSGLGRLCGRLFEMGSRVAVVATCNLNQWALDFDGNLQRIRESIAAARAAGARYRLGPELEVCGYGCEDHFLEMDTVEHCWEVVCEILRSDLTDDMLVDIGMPIVHRGVQYNSRVFLCNGRVVLVRPKLAMANDGNYREGRWFSPWDEARGLEELPLPGRVASVCRGGQRTAPIGHAVVRARDASVGVETCEELFAPLSPHVRLALNGVDIVSNGSGSHHQLRKLEQRLSLMQSATAKCGGVYMYANQQGCDGGRLYFDGCACVMVNGSMVAQGGQFSLRDVEVVTAAVDLDAVVSHRNAVSSLRDHAAGTAALPIVDVDVCLCDPTGLQAPTPRMAPRLHTPEEEISLGPACWLWDYLRRSGAAGFLLPLSGGADSASVAAIVGSMCQLALQAAREGDTRVQADVRRIGGYDGEALPTTAAELASRVLTTVYMGSENSSAETRERARRLAGEVGSHHLDVGIDPLVSALTSLFAATFGRVPRFRADGGSAAENLALQNIQARMRMVLAFMVAQLGPWVRGRAGFLLVLGSANVDECLRGYMTKYDCSSADINPIGGISKADLRRFLVWAADRLGYPTLRDVERAAPNAELEPLRPGVRPQTDEEDMGMSYEELSIYGRLRKVARAGPLSMYRALVWTWSHLSPTQVAEKVKSFFFYYAANRHKATTLTPAYHAESYSPDDNRFDHRPFLYHVRWPWQFRRVDEEARAAEGR